MPDIQKFFQKLLVSLFHLLILITPFVFTWVNEELFEFPKMLIVYAMAGLIAASWVSLMIVSNKLLIKRTKFDYVLGAFLASQILSTVFSMHPATSIFGYYTRFHGGLLSTICYITLYYAFVSTVTKKQLKSMYVTLFIAAIGVSLYAIPEHFGHSPSCFLITEGKVFDVSCWVQDVQSRVFGTFGQPNWLAAYAISLIPLGIALTITTSKQKTWSWQKIVYALAVLTLFLALIFTKSRSGILGLAVGLGILFAGSVYQRKAVEPTKFASITVAIGLIALVFGTPFSPSLSQLLSPNRPSETIQSTATNPLAPVANRLEVGGTDSGEIRKIVWQGAVKIWQRYPLFGSGVETFAYSYYQDRPMAHNLVSEWDFLYNKAHNEFLNFLATTGIVGLATYIALLGAFGIFTTTFIVKTQKEDTTVRDNNQIIALGLVSGTVALSISNFFGFSTVMVSLLLFLYFAFFEVISSQTKQHLETVALDNSSYLPLTMIWLTTLYILFIIYNMWSADKLYTLGKQYLEQQLLIDGAQTLEAAISKSPQALYYDKLSLAQAEIAAGLKELNESTAAAQFAQQAIITSDTALKKNPVHLNFYKTRARVFIYLTQVDGKYLDGAFETLKTAQQKAPTDAKLVYNQALILIEQSNYDQAIELLQQSIDMKPNYAAARSKLGDIFAIQGKIDQAKTEYQYILENITPEDPVTLEKLHLL